MEFPFGHHSHHSHRRDNDDDFPHPPPAFPPVPGAYPHAPSNPYPPAPFNSAYPPPPDPYAAPPAVYGPPPPVSGVYHSSHTSHVETPPYAPVSAAGVISHSHSHAHQHESGGGAHGFHPHMPGFVTGHFHKSESHHHEEEVGPLGRYFAKKPTFRLYCKAGGDRYAVTIRDGKVILVQHNPDDPAQHWYKDEKFSTKVKDSDGYPSFALVNKATGQAIKSSTSGQPVKLVAYNPDELDPSILWTESKDLGQGFRTIRMVNNVKLVMDAFHGDKDHGGVHDGTIVALYESWKGDNQNQQWRLSPY